MRNIQSLTGVSGRVTQLLISGDEHDKHYTEELLSLVYMELHAIARYKMLGERSNHTLSPTALVNEAYLRLLGDANIAWQNRRHFFSAASEAMRRILIDSARKKNSQKKGALAPHISFHDAENSAFIEKPEQILQLDSALDKLQKNNPDLADVVKLKYFSGLSNRDVAMAMETSERSINRRWMAARAWLLKEME